LDPLFRIMKNVFMKVFFFQWLFPEWIFFKLKNWVCVSIVIRKCLKNQLIDLNITIFVPFENFWNNTIFFFRIWYIGIRIRIFCFTKYSLEWCIPHKDFRKRFLTCFYSYSSNGGHNLDHNLDKRTVLFCTLTNAPW